MSDLTLLHEAGHLTTTPRRFRSWMDGDLGADQLRMFDVVCSANCIPTSRLIVGRNKCVTGAGSAGRRSESPK